MKNNFFQNFSTIVVGLSLGILLVTLVSCEKDPLGPTIDNYTLEINPRLDTTNEGYYRLELNSSGNSQQTIHRISGWLLNNGMEPYPPQKVEWESSHSWTLTDTALVIVRRTINVLGEWVTIDTTYVTQFAGYNVPTINTSSYSGTGGEINTVIAPIDDMLGDTMVVKAKFRDIEKYVKIILE